MYCISFYLHLSWCACSQFRYRSFSEFSYLDMDVKSLFRNLIHYFATTFLIEECVLINIHGLFVHSTDSDVMAHAISSLGYESTSIFLNNAAGKYRLMVCTRPYQEETSHLDMNYFSFVRTYWWKTLITILIVCLYVSLLIWL